jgi:DNA processing protein
VGFDLRTRVALTLSGAVGSTLFARLAEAFRDSEGLSRAGRSAISQVRGVGPAAAAAIERILRSDEPEREMELCRARGVRVLAPDDPGFPRALAAAADAPLALYVRGTVDDRDAQAAALVGTRRPSEYGRRIARELAGRVARAGVTVVSGLARGIDAEAHSAALAAGGRTIAVQGCGLDHVYPPEHAPLADRIASAGAMLSEFPLREGPRPEHFPRRNRLISGLAWITVCVEASPTSGAITTCDWALEQGRSVGAVPGPVGLSGSRGPHMLLRQGAKVIEDAADILEEIPSIEPAGPADLLQRCVFEAVRRGARDLDRIRASAGLREDVAARVVEELVRAGWVGRGPDGRLQSS